MELMEEVYELWSMKPPASAGYVFISQSLNLYCVHVYVDVFKTEYMYYLCITIYNTIRMRKTELLNKIMS